MINGALWPALSDALSGAINDALTGTPIDALSGSITYAPTAAHIKATPVLHS